MTPKDRRAWKAFELLLPELGTEMNPKAENVDRIEMLSAAIDEAAEAERARRRP